MKVSYHHLIVSLLLIGIVSCPLFAQDYRVWEPDDGIPLRVGVFPRLGVISKPNPVISDFTVIAYEVADSDGNDICIQYVDDTGMSAEEVVMDLPGNQSDPMLALLEQDD